MENQANNQATNVHSICRSALANWDTSTGNGGGGGGGGAAAVEWGAVELERGAGKVEEERM